VNNCELVIVKAHFIFYHNAYFQQLVNLTVRTQSHKGSFYFYSTLLANIVYF